MINSLHMQANSLANYRGVSQTNAPKVDGGLDVSKLVKAIPETHNRKPISDNVSAKSAEENVGIRQNHHLDNSIGFPKADTDSETKLAWDESTKNLTPEEKRRLGQMVGLKMNPPDFVKHALGLKQDPSLNEAIDMTLQSLYLKSRYESDIEQTTTFINALQGFKDSQQ